MEDLRGADERFVAELRAALIVAGTFEQLAPPEARADLLELIVQTAARAIPARAASLLLVDEPAEALIFAVALGPEAEAVRQLHVPLGHGIAGLVAVSGEPMAVSDAESDPRQAADIAARVGSVPQSILCVPILSGERVIGVLELLDKEGARSFSLADLELLQHFATLAATAIVQDRARRRLDGPLRGVLAGLGGLPADTERRLRARLDAIVADVEADAGFARSLDLARLVREIGGRGEEEQRAGLAILSGFVEYLRRRDPLGDRGAPQ